MIEHMPVDNPFPYLMAISSIVVGIVVGLGGGYMSHRASKRASETALQISMQQVELQYRLQARQLEAARLTAAYSGVMTVLTEARQWVRSVYYEEGNRLFGATEMPELVRATLNDGALQLGWSESMARHFDTWASDLSDFEKASAWLSRVLSGQIDPRQSMGATVDDAKKWHAEVRARVLGSDSALRHQMWSEINAIEELPVTTGMANGGPARAAGTGPR